MQSLLGDVLLQVLVRSSDEVLKSYSKTVLWDEVKSILENQYYWYLRIQYLTGVELDWKSDENWKTAYLLLSSISDWDNADITEDMLFNPLIVRILLKMGYNLYNSEHIEWFMDVGALDSLRLALDDPRSNVTGLIEEGIRHRLALDTILANKRVDSTGDEAIAYINERSSYTTASLLLPLVIRQETDLSKLTSESLKNITSLIRSWSSVDKNAIAISNSLNGIRLLSGIIPDLSVYYTSFNDNHYDMLLREIVLKQSKSDLDYFKSWIDKWLIKNSTNQRTRDLILSARSRSKKHASNLFTAYRGFYLLPGDGTGIDIINQMSTEEGVTDEGLDMAASIVGAFLGESNMTRRQIEEQA